MKSRRSVATETFFMSGAPAPPGYGILLTVPWAFGISLLYDGPKEHKVTGSILNACGLIRKYTSDLLGHANL